MFEIYSIGDADLLIQVINGVAALFGAGGLSSSGAFIVSGFLCGLFITCFKAIISQKLELHTFLAAFVLYNVMFVPKVTVNVEDAYTGTVVPVANVPIGVAAPYAIFSQMGYWITQKEEQAFSMPRMTDVGFIDPLHVLMATQNPDFGTANYNLATNDMDLARTLQNYINDCVLRDINSATAAQDVQFQGVLNATDMLAAISVNAPAWTTTTFLTGQMPAGVTATCNDAFTALNTQLRSGPWLTEWFTYLQSTRGITLADVNSLMADMMNTATNAQQFMLNRIVEKHFIAGVVSQGAYNPSPAASAMLAQSMAQRNIQGAAQKSLFEEYARPLMAFVESFIFSLAPFMAFIVTLGGLGFPLLGKYLITLLWIQTWPPCMALVNLYTLNSFDKFTTDMATEIPTVSMLGMNSIYTNGETWLAISGAMAAAIPAITLFLVTGSAIGMVNMLNRMQGTGDFVDEKAGAPEVMSSTKNGVQIGDSTVGITSHGNSVMGHSPFADPRRQLQIGSLHQNALQHSQSTVDSLQNQYATSMMDSLGSDSQFQSTMQSMVAYGSGSRGNLTERQEAASRIAQSMGEKYGWSSDERGAIAATLSASASGGIGLNARMLKNMFSQSGRAGGNPVSQSKSAGGGFELGVKGVVQGHNQGTLTDSRAQELLSQFNQEIGENSSLAADYSQFNDLTAREQRGDSGSQGVFTRAASQNQDTAQKLRSAQEMNTSLKNASSNMSISGNYDLGTLSANGVNNFVMANIPGGNGSYISNPSNPPMPETPVEQRALYEQQILDSFQQGNVKRAEELMGYAPDFNNQYFDQLRSLSGTHDNFRTTHMDTMGLDAPTAPLNTPEAGRLANLDSGEPASRINELGNHVDTAIEQGDTQSHYTQFTGETPTAGNQTQGLRTKDNIDSLNQEFSDRKEDYDNRTDRHGSVSLDLARSGAEAVNAGPLLDDVLNSNEFSDVGSGGNFGTIRSPEASRSELIQTINGNHQQAHAHDLDKSLEDKGYSPTWSMSSALSSLDITDLFDSPSNTAVTTQSDTRDINRDYAEKYGASNVSDALNNIGNIQSQGLGYADTDEGRQGHDRELSLTFELMAGESRAGKEGAPFIPDNTLREYEEIKVDSGNDYVSSNQMETLLEKNDSVSMDDVEQRLSSIKSGKN